MTRGLSFSAAKQISTEEMLVISEHLDAGSGPPKDQRTKTDGMALLLIPEGGLHSSIDSLVSTLYLLSRYSAFLKVQFYTNGALASQTFHYTQLTNTFTQLYPVQHQAII